MDKQDKNQTTNIDSKGNDFVLNLERASNAVKKWPEWKQNAWGPVINRENS
ncbi:MAG: hypothetical protein V2B14_02765 [bacterium]